MLILRRGHDDWDRANLNRRVCLSS
jgi:hypothetical protein